MYRFLLRSAAGLAALLLTPWLAHADVKDSTASGFTVENSAVVTASATVAWHALVDHVDAWWPKDHTWWGKKGVLSIDARAAGCFCERFGERQAEHMQVVMVEPGKLLRLVGGLGPLQGMGLNGVMEWRFAAADGGTKITYWYRAGGYTPDDLASLVPIVDQVEAQQLAGLVNFLRDRAVKAVPKAH